MAHADTIKVNMQIPFADMAAQFRNVADALEALSEGRHHVVSFPVSPIVLEKIARQLWYSTDEYKQTGRQWNMLQPQERANHQVTVMEVLETLEKVLAGHV